MTTAVRERPMIFSGPMTRAILSGRKTQTRRVMKGEWVYDGETGVGASWEPPACKYGSIGDRLYIKEKWALVMWDEDETDDWTHPIPKTHPGLGWSVHHAAGSTYETDCLEDRGFRWRPSIHMPRWASRITLEITDVKVELLQDISGDDAMAEGVDQTEFWTPKELEGRPFEEKWWDDYHFWNHYPQMAYRRLWESIHGSGSWDLNPYIWAISFKRIA